MAEESPRATLTPPSLVFVDRCPDIVPVFPRGQARPGGSRRTGTRNIRSHARADCANVPRLVVIDHGTSGDCGAWPRAGAIRGPCVGHQYGRRPRPLRPGGLRSHSPSPRPHAELILFGPRISTAVEAKPSGLLLHENILFSLRHFGMRQYWRDFESLETWSRSEPHRVWWQQFLRDSRATGFWHETYFRRGGIEAVYVDMQSPIGLARFAPVEAARGAMFSARKRAGIGGEPKQREGVTETEFYSRIVQSGPVARFGLPDLSTIKNPCNVDGGPV